MRYNSYSLFLFPKNFEFINIILIFVIMKRHPAFKQISIEDINWIYSNITNIERIVHVSSAATYNSLRIFLRDTNNRIWGDKMIVLFTQNEIVGKQYKMALEKLIK